MNFKSLFILGLAAGALASCKNTPAPEAIMPIPTPEQIEWQKMETYAFVHFGLNTFNDLEWGFGDTPATTFDPTDLDCEQWVKTIKGAGLKGVILTAKHHDGFCLWPTATTEYSVKASPWKNGQGDMVKELSDACKKHGLKFGIYLSPWDRNNAEYGRPDYVDTFHAQMTELLTNYGPIFEYWFDGANGGNGFYGGTNEHRNIDAKTYYQYEKAREVIKQLHPSAMIFGGTCADIRWIGNESGWAGETNWSPMSEDKMQHHSELQWGMEDGHEWLPGEVDVSVRPGWFYHEREDHQVRSLANLVDLYYNSVGRNANLLLNFPVALSGKIHPTDSARVAEWYATISEELDENLLANAKASASATRGDDSKFGAAKANDTSWDTYWATNDGETTGSLTFTFAKPTPVNRLLIQEYIPLGQRVKAFNIECESNGLWHPVQTTDTMSTVGYKRIIRFKSIAAEKIRINFTDAKGPLCINNVEAFLAPALVTEPSINRNAANEVIIKAGDSESEVYFTTDGSTPTVNSERYTAPFTFAQKGEIKAIAYDRNFDKTSPVSARKLDIPTSQFKVTSTKDEGVKYMFDGNGYTTYYLPEGKKEIVVDLGGIYEVDGFRYTPNQGRDAGGHIGNYEFYVDNKKVASGEFSNIKHNPIEQQISFTPTQGKTVKMVITHIVDNQKRAGVGEFSVTTK